MNPRWTTWLLGVIVIGLAILPQLSQFKWTYQYGLDRMDSGKASIQVCWSVLTLMADTAVLTAWTMWCMFKPRRWWSAILAALALLLLWALALPAAMIASGLLRNLTLPY